MDALLDELRSLAEGVGNLNIAKKVEELNEEVLYDQQEAKIDEEHLRLTEEEKASTRAKVLASVHAVQSTQDRVRLNVGGRKFTTSRQTILQDPVNLFVELLASLEEGSELFLDRDPNYFAIILQYLRDGRFSLPTEASKRRALLQEARFYRINSLIDILEGRQQPSKPVSTVSQQRQPITPSLPSTDLRQTKTHRGQDNDDDGEADLPLRCYMCKKYLPADHIPSDAWHTSLCNHCIQTNAKKCSLTADLSGRTALVTGGRVKIGLMVSLKLLRLGATVLITTRFPQNALATYEAEADFNTWRTRLRIFAVDFRHLPSVHAFIAHILTTTHHLDILINNAAQTVRRPPAYYRSLVAEEILKSHDIKASSSPVLESFPGSSSLIDSFTQFNRLALPQADHFESSQSSLNALTSADTSLPLSVLLSQVQLIDEDQMALAQQDELFPMGSKDLDGQQLDMRDSTSWTLRAAQVTATEIVEVQTVNSTVPFLLLSQLTPLFKRSPFSARFVVNVSSPEGQFQTSFKSPVHPHTNMAKAALNMLTRTCAVEYAIHHSTFINSVDTGWVSKMSPTPKQANARSPPLNLEDAVARVLDPILTSLQPQLDVMAAPSYGLFLRNFHSAPW